MIITAEEIVTDTIGLPPVARAFVAEKLVESLDESAGRLLSENWKEESRRRCVEIDNSAEHLRDADAVFKNAYASLAGKISCEQGYFSGSPMLLLDVPGLPPGIPIGIKNLRNIRQKGIVWT